MSNVCTNAFLRQTRSPHEAKGVGEREWLYKTIFSAPSVPALHNLLEFEGLDTFCDIYLV
jgi:beta-mannosidase